MTAPGPLNLIHAEVPNRMIGTFPFMFIPGFLVPLGGSAARSGYPVDHQPRENGSRHSVNAGSLLFPSKVQNRMRVPLMFSMASEAGIVPYQERNGSPQHQATGSNLK